MTALPSYADLPVRAGAPRGSAWGVWGDDDTLGCWNTVDAAATRRGLAAATRGEAHALTIDDDPHLTRASGRTPPVHEVREVGGGIALDDVLAEYNTQGSTQWDGFRHIESAAGLYNGLGHDRHGVHHWARQGIATRGVLVDVARWRDAQGRPIDVPGREAVPLDEVLATLDDQGTTVEPGDVLFFRWGWYEWWLEHGAAATEFAVPGLEPSERAAATLWDWHVAAVAGDSGVEPYPGRSPRARPTADELVDPAWCFGLSLHFLLPWFGMPIGELFDLRSLAAACEHDGDWTFLLTVAPINLPNGVATPGNAVAVR